MKKALTIWQPYASLIMHQIKLYETRSWTTSYRGPVIIHAAAAWTDKQIALTQELLKLLPDAEFLNNLPLSAALGEIQLIDVKRSYPTSAFVGEMEKMVGNWTTNDYAWQMQSPVLWKKPLICKGYQGLWNWDLTKLTKPKQVNAASLTILD